MRNSLARRVLWVHVILLLALCGVLLRIFVIGQGEQYRQTAAAQSRYTLSAGTARGNIYDCRLRPLVNESEKTVLAVDPTPAAMTALRQGLSAEQFEEIYPLLQSGRPVLIPSDFPISGEGITALRVPQRYSADQLAPHIIGYINGEGRGICGIESGYEEQLTRWGGEITVRYTVNAWRQATGQAPEVTDPTDHTAGIVLTLDKDLQTIVEREGAVLGRGAVVLLEAETGAICAMASFPGYDVTDVAAALEAADSPLLNRATAAWNVGSIFKVCGAAAALENEVELPENYCCEGFYRLGDHSYFCHERAGHGTLDLQQAMQLSCNPYFVELGQRTGALALLRMAQRLGFGAGSQLAEGVNSSAGSLPTLAQATPGELANLSFGQGRLTATPVQVAGMLAAVANGGYAVQPTLFAGRSFDGKILQSDPAGEPIRVMNTETAETLRALLVSVVEEGTGYRAKTRFAKFYNLPELMAAFKEVADIQTADMLHLPVPKAKFQTEVIQPSELQKEMIQGLAERAEKIRAGGVDPHVDNMLRITNDGRKLALDMRLINPLAADDPNGKVAVCARNVFRIWEQTKEKRSAQLVFCDLSTPTTDGSFSVYDDLKKKLMDAGIPEEEIAFIHTADSEAKKKELFSKVRAGQVRVLLGSTAKMGAGTNVQDKLIALHDLDCPWRPSDLQQRLGRIVRQGNENEEVEIYRYVTEGTFDAYLYQLVENKQKFIAQIMTSKAPVRVADDVDETALSYSEIKALATGNPLIIEKCNLDMEVARLNMLKASHLNQVYALEELVYRKYPEEITQLTERIAGYEQDVALAAAHPKAQEGFCGMEVDGRHYTEKEGAGKAIIDVCTRMTGSDAVLLGQYRGFSMVLAYDGRSNEYRITLKGTLSHTVTLGADVFGNITRLDNALENLAGSLQAEQNSLEETKAQLENARTELATPFAREEELAEKTARLKELNILLNMDEKDKTLMDDTPDEGEDVPARRVAELAR